MSENRSDYEKHLDVAKDIQATRDESWRYVEKMHYSIASGALALSITLLTFTSIKTCKWLIITSWIVLVISIIINFISHIVAYDKSGRAIDMIYDRMADNKKFSPSSINEIISWHNCLTKWLNWISIGTLILGVLGVLIFFIIQILH